MSPTTIIPSAPVSSAKRRRPETEKLASCKGETKLFTLCVWFLALFFYREIDGGNIVETEYKTGETGREERGGGKGEREREQGSERERGVREAA